MKKKKVLIIGLIAAFLLVLFLTNPSEEKYEEFALAKYGEPPAEV